MRTLAKNKQKMWYSNLSSAGDGYEHDSDGNIVYDLIDGEKVPRESSQRGVGYESPVEFVGNIHSSGGEAQSTFYGVSTDGYDAVLYDVKGQLPITETTLIWYQHTPEVSDDGTFDPQSADYVVKRVPPALNEVVYLLQKISNEQDDQH